MLRYKQPPARAGALTLALLIYLSPVAHAEEVEREGFPGIKNPFDVSLYYQTYDIELDYDGETVRSDFERIGIGFMEHFHRHIQAGLDLGYAAQRQRENPATDAQTLTGGYIGLKLRTPIIDTTLFDLSAQGAYTFYVLDASNEDQDTRLDWREAQADIEGGITLGRVRLGLGARYQVVNGDERARGNVDSDRGVKEIEPLSGTAGVDILLDNAGRISLYGEGGGHQGLYIGFAKSY